MSRPSKQEIDDVRNASKLEAAFMAANKTPTAPASAGAGRGFVNPPMAAPAPQAPMGMAKGGSASSRADGCAERGKTRGTIVMCGGGMYKK